MSNDGDFMFVLQDGSLGIVFGPTQDSGWYINMPFFSQTPYDMRLSDQYDTMPAIIGINAKDGAKIASKRRRNVFNHLNLFLA